MDDLIPPQPRPKSPKPRWLGAGILTGLAAVLFQTIFKDDPSPNGGPTERILGLGHRWEASEISWRQLNGQWELTVLMEHKRQVSRNADNLRDVPVEATARALCGPLLSTLPSRQDPTISRADIFRLNVNFIKFENGRPTNDAVFPMPVPLQINDRACPEDVPANRFPLQYPEPWDGLAFNGFVVDPIDTIAHWQVDAVSVFAWEADGALRVTLQDLCTAAIFEAPLWRPEGALMAGDKIAIGLHLEADQYTFMYGVFDGDTCSFTDPPEVSDV